MKRISSFLLFLVSLAFCVGSCDTPAAKQVSSFEKEIKSVSQLITETDDCDELQMLNFAIMGMRSDLDNMMQDTVLDVAELRHLDDMMGRLEDAWQGKWTTIGCEQATGGGDLDTSGDGEFQDYDIL